VYAIFLVAITFEPSGGHDSRSCVPVVWSPPPCFDTTFFINGKLHTRELILRYQLVHWLKVHVNVLDKVEY
jgi:hypothetical protein